MQVFPAPKEWMLEAEDISSKLDVSCIAKSLCEFGFNLKVDPKNEIAFAAHESIQ